ncbi:MAG: citrate synthase [Clostridia bacterium]|nr:citrate synthase [Clostridia bacterium]
MTNRLTVPQETLTALCAELRENTAIDTSKYAHYDIKRGLRNADGSGVVAGLTRVCNVHGYVMNEGEKEPIDGELTYRGINIEDLVEGYIRRRTPRYGFEETAYLLLFGHLPSRDQLASFNTLLESYRELPDFFTEDMILKSPSPNIMNMMQRSVLSLYSYDKNADDVSMENLVRQSIFLLSMLPSIMSYAYQVKRRVYDRDSMYFHPLIENSSTAETVLRSLRPDGEFTAEEANLLDICLMIHAEHGGGNCSTFTSRVLSSSGTDTYSAVSAAIGALKGPRHGGANIKVMEMLSHMQRDIHNPADEDEVVAYLRKLLAGEAGDGSGLVYGMGHAVYTKSDPRAVLLKKYARSLAEKNGFGDEFRLLELVEKHTPRLVVEKTGHDTGVCANVDLYSGLVYRTLGLSPELYTPLFALARTAGWCAHRIEELTHNKRIIRPAYKAIVPHEDYVDLDNR